MGLGISSSPLQNQFYVYKVKLYPITTLFPEFVLHIYDQPYDVWFDRILLIYNLVRMFNFGSKLRVFRVQENIKEPKKIHDRVFA